MLALREAAGGQWPMARNGDELGRLPLQFGLSSLHACRPCSVKVPEDQRIASPRRSMSSPRLPHVVYVGQRAFLPVSRLESRREFRKTAA